MAFSPVVYGKIAHKEGVREAGNGRESLGASPRTAENVSLQNSTAPLFIIWMILKGHPEFSSGSHRESFL